MADIDYIGLAKLASTVSAAAKECVNVVQDIRRSGGETQDPTLKNLQQDISCFTEVSHYLCLQLGTSYVGLAADEWGDRFWTCLRLVLESWLKSTKRNLEHLREFQRQRASTWIGWLFSSSRFTRLMEEFAVVNLDSRLEDAQLITTLFNLQLELQNVEADRRHLFGFLGRDLEWKALKIQINMSRFRHQQSLDPNWGRTQVVIAEVALATATHAKSLDQAANTPGVENVDTAKIDATSTTSGKQMHEVTTS